MTKLKFRIDPRDVVVAIALFIVAMHSMSLRRSIRDLQDSTDALRDADDSSREFDQAVAERIHRFEREPISPFLEFKIAPHQLPTNGTLDHLSVRHLDIGGAPHDGDGVIRVNSKAGETQWSVMAMDGVPGVRGVSVDKTTRRKE